MIPERRSSLLGREGDIVGALALLDEHRLVTLSGVGGVGKSSVAHEVARRCEERGSEVHLVDLATATDATSVAVLVADQLGLAATAGVSPLDALATAFARGDGALLVLDSCEHVRDEAADLVDDLLARSTELRVLATSRVRLDVDGEAVCTVEPLPIGDVSDAGSAAALLADRARAAGAVLRGADDDARLVELARRLDGVPLALELAAARLATMSAGELLAQLDEQLASLGGRRRRGSERHRSLGAVVEWSFDLLDPAEQQLLARLSVFAGGFDREAAIAVAGVAAGAGIHELVEVSLVERIDVDGGTRYRMLEMIRAFARQHLEPDDDVALRHARWAAQWARDCKERMRGPAEAALVPVFRRELANIGAALRWAAEHGERELVAELAIGLGDHLYSRGGRELQEWIEHARAVLEDPDDIEELLLLAALAAHRRGDLASAERLIDEAEARGFAGDRMLMGTAEGRGTLTMFQGRIEEAGQHLAAAVTAAERDDPVKAGMYCALSALPLAYTGQYERALERAEEGMRRSEGASWPTAMSATTYALAESLIGIDRDAALEAYRRSVQLSREVENSFFLSIGLVSWASALARHGDPVQALELFADAVDDLGSIGAWSYLSTTLRNLGELLVRLERYEDSLVIRSAIEQQTGSTAASGVDAVRDGYLKALLADRILPDRYAALEREGGAMSRDYVVRRAERVIAGELAARRRGTELRAVVFTDLEGATAYMAEHGDQAARAVMRRYEELTEGLLTASGGRRVKGTGDGMLATFPTVSGALRCVQRLLQLIDERPDELPLRVRVGVHAGEMIDETLSSDGDDIHGTVVNLTARVVDRADGGEVVVTDTIRQIVVGSDLVFTPLGEFDLKGIPEPIRLHRLERG